MRKKRNKKIPNKMTQFLKRNIIQFINNIFFYSQKFYSGLQIVLIHMVI